MEFIKDINLTPNEAYKNSHYFCDYVELQALLNNDLLSVSDIFDLFFEDNKIDDNDKWTKRIEEWFILLQDRKDRFREFYPYEVNKNSITLKQNLNNKHKLYIFLLLLSLQRYISKHKNLLTTKFEIFSIDMLNNYFFKNVVIEHFGKNINSKGSLKEKIDKLSKQLGYRTKYDQRYLENNNGDGGVDIVAWIPFWNDSNLSNIQLFLCQCATGKEWVRKPYDLDKFKDNFIDFDTIVTPVLIIPYDIRDYENRFYSKTDFKNNIILFDRMRLLYLVFDENIIEKYKSLQIIDNFIEYVQDII
jgi:hypothetical protein